MYVLAMGYACKVEIVIVVTWSEFHTRDGPLYCLSIVVRFAMQYTFETAAAADRCVGRMRVHWAVVEAAARRARS